MRSKRTDFEYSIKQSMILVMCSLLLTFSLSCRPAPAPALETFTLTGRVLSEDENNLGNVIVGLQKDGISGYVAFAITDETGTYKFTQLPIPQIDNRESEYLISAEMAGFSKSYLRIQRDTRGLYTTGPNGYVQIYLSNNIVNVPAIVLFKPKRVTLEWIYQPDGTPNFFGSELISGETSLVSSHTTYIEKPTSIDILRENGIPGPVTRRSNNNGFVFKQQIIAESGADFLFVHSYSIPTFFLVHNGAGGIHDMGDVSLESIVSAPDKLKGVGTHKYYDSSPTKAIVGHTYCVVTGTGAHYAKFRVTEISPLESEQIVTDPAANTIISIGEVKIEVGDEVAADISTRGAIGGLSGYDLNVSITDEAVAEIVDVVFPNFGLTSISELPSSTVRIMAVDLNDIVPPRTEEALLATLKLRGIVAGTSKIHIIVHAMDDDKGAPVEPHFSLDSIVVQEAG